MSYRVLIERSPEGTEVGTFAFTASEVEQAINAIRSAVERDLAGAEPEPEPEEVADEGEELLD